MKLGAILQVDGAGPDIDVARGQTVDEVVQITLYFSGEGRAGYPAGCGWH